MKGTIRDEIVRFDGAGQQPVGSILDVQGLDFQPFTFDGLTGDRNTLRIGTVVITSKTR